MILYQEDIKRLIEIQEYIHSNLEKDLSVDNISRIFSLSSAKLQRHFSVYFRHPIHQYIHSKRMLHARELLNNRSNFVSDIAIKVGYKDRSSFTRAFIKFFKEKPTDHLKGSLTAL